MLLRKNSVPFEGLYSSSDIEMNFLPKYMHCNGLKLSGALEELSTNSLFLGSKMQKFTFKENKRFECSFIEFKYM